jgi:hypothetical protein
VKIFEKKDKAWSVQLLQGLDATIMLPQINVKLLMNDIYDVKLKIEEQEDIN